jgi:cytohesin
MKHILLTTIAAVLLVGTVFADPIHDVAWKGDLAGVQAELDKGVDVDEGNDSWPGMTPLHYAADEGHTEVVELLIANGADVNAKNENGWTPLHLAAYWGGKEIVELLIAAGADVNAKDMSNWIGTPLDIATHPENPIDTAEIAELLRKHGGKTSEELKDLEAVKESIHAAARVGHIEAVKQHLTAGTDVNAKGGVRGETPLHSAAGKGHKEVAELLIANGADVNAKDRGGFMPLDEAIINENTEIVDLLRKHDGKSGAEDSIQVAASVGNIEAVKQHLAAGADVNAKDDWGMTPLHRTAEMGRKEIAELLIAKGADVNAQSDMGTPLHLAAGFGHKEIVELLIANGADVNAKGGDVGLTPLHFATFNGHKEIAELLIANGADVNANDIGGGTPLDYANGVVANLLRKHGGKTGEELKALMPRLVQHGQFAFSFVAKKGKVYEVQDSFDLLNWEVIKTYTGTGSSVRFDEERDHDPPQWFYRVRVVE